MPFLVRKKKQGFSIKTKKGKEQKKNNKKQIRRV